MEGAKLQQVEEEKDLGVIISASAKPTAQCVQAAKKRNQILDQIVRSFKCCDKETFSQLYKVFVRPHLEYVIQAWCTYSVRDIDLLERVQKRMVRQISNLNGSYEEKLQQINLTTLRERRVHSDMIETFKMMKGLTKVDPSIWFQKIERDQGVGTRLSNDPLALQQQKPRLDLRKNFFSIRVPPIWNSLPLAIKKS
jgi:IS1 family transposase